MLKEENRKKIEKKIEKIKKIKKNKSLFLRHIFFNQILKFIFK